MTINIWEHWEHEEFSQLAIDEELMAAEFKVATRQALENMKTEFDFYGQTVEINDALEAIDEHEDGRTYH